jgi:hypothetical protein
VEAANGFMARQLLFDTSCPFRPLAQTVRDFAALGLPLAAQRLAMWETPARVLGAAAASEV